MTKDKVIEYAILWFKDIQEMSKRITTGNISHDTNTLRGFAGRCAEFLEEHKNDET